MEVDDVAGRLERQIHDCFVRVVGRQQKNTEYVLPAGSNVFRLRVDHLGNAAHHHVANGDQLVVLHDVLEWTEKIFLEAEIGEFAFLDEFHGELAK